MRLATARLRLGALTFVFLAAIGVVLYFSFEPSQSMQVQDLSGPRAPVGEMVKFGGTIVSADGLELVVAPETGSGPPARVTLAASSSEMRLGVGMMVILRGKLVEPGAVENAVLSGPGPPVKYTEANDDR